MHKGDCFHSCVAVCCSVLQCVAVCCSALQCVAVWCIVHAKQRLFPLFWITRISQKSALCQFYYIPQLNKYRADSENSHLENFQSEHWIVRADAIDYIQRLHHSNFSKVSLLPIILHTIRTELILRMYRADFENLFEIFFQGEHRRVHAEEIGYMG